MTRSSKTVLQPKNTNVVRKEPLTPGKKVRHLESELEKKDAENEALRNNIAALNKALGGLSLANDKISTLAVNKNYNLVSEVDNDDKKVKKDEGAPIPAKTAYKFFCDSVPREEGVDMRQLWKECDPTKREKFTNMAKHDKARYEVEMISFKEEKEALALYYEKQKEDAAMEFYEAHIAAQTAMDNADTNKKGKKNSKKDPEAPKRPTSSYFYFAAEKRDAVKKVNSGASPTEISKILGEMWSKLGKGKRGKNGTKKYDDLAAADKVRYAAEKAVYDEMIAKRNAESEKQKIDSLNKDKEEAMKLMNMFKHASNVVTSEVSNSLPQTDDMSAVSDITGGGSDINDGKKTRKKKDPNAPKRSTSAYIYFCTENRSRIKESMPEGTKQNELLSEIGRQWKILSESEKEKYVQMANNDKERYAKEMETYKAGKN